MHRDFAAQRERMVHEQIAARGVRDSAVLGAMREVPREIFVAGDLGSRAYEDGPLEIGFGQTISQPFVVASMVETLAIGPRDRVLEIGAGSGYAAAVIGRIACEVWAIERIRELAEDARARIERLGYSNVHVIHADGLAGWPAAAPYDAIAVAAAGSEIPEALKRQLAPGGRLVMPVGPPGEQRLVRVLREGDRYSTVTLYAVRFVPLVGS